LTLPVIPVPVPAPIPIPVPIPCPEAVETPKTLDPLTAVGYGILFGLIFGLIITGVGILVFRLALRWVYSIFEPEKKRDNEG